MKKGLMLVVFLAGVGVCLGAPINFNGGFELGTAGYALTRNLEPDVNPQLEYLPLELDRQAPGAGRQSALIRNGRGEPFELHSKEFQFKKDVEYDVSFKAKSSVSASWLRIILYSVNSDGKYCDDGTGKMLSPQWTEYTFTMKAKLPGWYHFKLSSRKACDFWLDDLSIAEKIPAVPANPFGAFIEAAVVSSSYLYDKDEDSAAKFTLKVVNIGTAPGERTLKLVGRDEYFGDELFSLECPVSLAAGESNEFLFEQPLTRYGSVRVEVSGAGNSHLGFYSVIGHYDSKPVDINKTFCVGLNGHGKWLSPRIPKPAYIVKNDSLESCLSTYERMGCRIIREWGGGVGSTQWYQMEPTRGGWDYSYLDKQLELYRKFHIEALPVIGNDDFIARTQNYQQLFLPEWLIPLCERVKKDPPNVTEERVRGNVLLPPEDLWRAYVRNCMRHAKGRFQAVEIMNEPNLFLAPEVYNRYLKAASEEIRAAGSKTTIVGFCLSSDFGASALDWGKTCFKDGGLKYVDAVGFHPYGSRQLNSPFPADKDIAGLRSLLKPYGDYPFWNTELFYVTDTPSPNYVVKSECQAYHVAWRFLTDLGEGAKQSICLQSDQIWKPLLTPNCVSMDRVTEWAPSEIAVAYNALARIFEGATPVDSVRWGNDTACYVYEREGKPLAAFWNHGGMKNVKLKLDAGEASGLKLLDIFGNEIKFPEDGVLTLSETPFYLVVRARSAFNIFSSEMSVKEFLSFLKNGRVEAARPVEPCALGRFVPKNGGWKVVVAFRNCAGRGLVGKLSLHGEGVDAADSVAFSIPAGEELSLPIPVKLDAAKLCGKVAAKFELEGRTWEFPLAVGRPGKVLRPGGQERFGPAAMKLEDDGKTLRLSFDVKDSTPDAYVAGGAPWMQDCVELSFDAAPLRNSVKYPERYTDDVARLFLLPNAPEGERLVMQPRGLKLDGAKAICAKWDGGYSVELEIPRTAFAGKTIGFESQIDDGDAVDRKAQASWNSNGDAYKNRLSFGFIELDGQVPGKELKK